MTDNETIFLIVSKIIKDDGDYNAREHLYLMQLAKSLLISEDVVERLMKEETATIAIPKPEPDRMMIMLHILLAMKSDRHISREEEALAFTYGFKLGFRESLIREFIEVVKRYAAAKLPPQSLIEKVKKYLN